MFKCPNLACSNTTLYSDNFILGNDSEGKPFSDCRSCGETLVAKEKEPERVTAALNTRGCSGGSSHFTH